MFRAPGGGGVRRVIEAKRAGLSARGWNHTVVVPHASADGEIACGGVPIPGSGGYRFVVGRRHAARLIENARPDVVEAADPTCSAGRCSTRPSGCTSRRSRSATATCRR
ncbi:MAG: hypothetical protein MZW92_48375 [Comamonadaceae bacterium]|nr:hypothetical protein [Comamonadaceae bacterium]